MRKINCILFALLVLTSCAERGEVEREAPVVGVLEVGRGKIAKGLYFTGTIRAKDEVELHSKVSGKVCQKLVKKGDYVNRGEVLFLIERDEVGYKFQKVKVEAPISGRVSSIYVDIGSKVYPKTPLAHLQDDSTVKVRIWVGQKDYTLISEGQRAIIKLPQYPEETFEGVVSEISPSFDPLTHSALVEIEVPNPQSRFKPGMFANVEVIVEGKENAILIPFDAILKDEVGEYVYLIQDGVAYKRYIRTGIRSKGMVEVLEGLRAGDLIVHTGEEFLRPGLKVKGIPE